MRAAMDETQRRREIQNAYNQANGITPKTIVKSVRDLIEISHTPDAKGKKGQKALSKKEVADLIAKLEKEMKEASRRLEFEYAAILRDQIIELRGKETKD
jgi:excinuclease ABC subunit B